MAAKPATSAALQAAVLHQQAGRLDEARKIYQRVLRTEPRNADALQMLGLVWLDQGMADKGFQLLRRAASYAPKSASALNNLAVELCRAGQQAEALPYFDRLIALDGASIEARYNRLRALSDLQRDAEALEAADELVAIDPAKPRAQHSRGKLLQSLGRESEALAAYEAALAAGSTPLPLRADLLFARGTALEALGRLTEAGASFEAALNLRPDDAQCLLRLGNLLFAQRRFGAALEVYSLALAHPDVAVVALSHRAAVLLELGRLTEARDAFASLLEQSPGFDYARGQWLHAKLRLCDWADYDAAVADLRTRIERGERAVLPLCALAHEPSPVVQLRCAQIFAAQYYPPLQSALSLWAEGRAGVRAQHPRIRIAYLSADFRNHAMCFLMAGVFEQHDRSRFEVTAVSFGQPEDSDYGRRVHAAFDHVLDVSDMNDQEAAAAVRGLGIDVAIDLMGHTAGCRAGLLARRVAPVQVNYLGYPGSFGADYVDAIIADATVIPPGSEAHYSERVVRLPVCFQANDDQRRAGATPSREDAGLPPAGFVFCCFSGLHKLSPGLFAVFMRILAAVPGSVLWLEANEAAQANLRREAAAHGIDPARLVFAGPLPYPDHLGRLRLAGLALDTTPFNGGATASDALWSGVPLVSLMGESFASRMGGSLLHALGLGELIARDLAGFEQIAVTLARDAAALAAVRARLVAAGRTSAVFQTVQFARALEHALIALHARTSPTGMDVEREP